MQRGAGIIVDALLVALAGLVLLIILTGGAVVVIGGVRVSATGVDNPLLALALLGTLRYVVLTRVPWFGNSHWHRAAIDLRGRTVIAALQQRIDTIDRRSAVRLVAIATIAATAIKILLAWANPGFFSGDDVEVHEMSLRALWRTDWPIWDLRNALFPLGVIYPVQKLFALAGGVPEASTLVFAGRLPVALLSSLTIVLLWRGGAKLWPGAPGWAVVAAVLFATSKLHIAFGSSELPRPVSTVLVVGAFVLLQEARAGRIVVAAMLLGAAAALRFSEAVFVAPAVVTLVWQRRGLPAAGLGAVAGLTFVSIVGLTDAWYWGEPWHSLKAVVDYTLVQKLSSRGYQNVLWYVTHAFEWLNPATLVLMLFAAARAPRVTDLWFWTPVVLLSLLPHKEARYCIPLAPFACLMAARGLQAILPMIHVADVTRTQAWRPVALLAALAIGFVQDAGHWRLPRSNADVAFGRRLDATLTRDVPISAEQAWRLGGRIYLHPRSLVDLDPDRLGDASYLWQQSQANAAMVLDGRTMSRAGLAAALRARGYQRVSLEVTGARYQLWTAAQTETGAVQKKP
jgi:hypothetical protein